MHFCIIIYELMIVALMMSTKKIEPKKMTQKVEQMEEFGEQI